MADPVVARELKSLHEELAASQRARRAPPPDHPAAADAKVARAAAAVPAEALEEAADEQELRGEFREFVDEVTKFFEDAEKNVAAHPTASVVGALVVGILIGRLLARR